MNQQHLPLAQHFGYGRLLRYTFPAIVMMVITSVYTVVDGFFVSNFVGKISFAAVNFVFPVIMILGSVGFMFGTGGGALIAKTLGEGNHERANRLFSLVVFAALLCGVILAAAALVFLRPLLALLGAQGQLLHDSVVYGTILLLALPFFILQYEFQCLFATAGKPKLGLVVTLAAGLTNMVLDALFVVGLRWGLAGAAGATAFSQLVGGLIPVLYFARPNRSWLRLGRFVPERKALAVVCTNGASELLSNISSSLVSLLFNLQLIRYAGENGVAAYGVLMYVCLCATRLGSRCMLPPVASRIRLHVGGGWCSRGDRRAAGRSCQRENDSRGLYAPEKPYAFWHREKARQYPWPIFEGRGITKMARRGFLSGPF